MVSLTNVVYQLTLTAGLAIIFEFTTQNYTDIQVITSHVI